MASHNSHSNWQRQKRDTANPLSDNNLPKAVHAAQLLQKKLCSRESTTLPGEVLTQERANHQRQHTKWCQDGGSPQGVAASKSIRSKERNEGKQDSQPQDCERSSVC